MCGRLQIIECRFGAQGSEIGLRQIEGGQLLGRVIPRIVDFLNDNLNAAHTALHRENTTLHMLPYAMDLTHDLCALTNG